MGNRETALRNLKKRGAEANPDGRPKGSISLVGAIKRKLKSNPEQADEIIEVLFSKAKDGDMTAIKEVLNRTDGLPQQNIHQTGNMNMTWNLVKYGETPELDD